MCCCRTAGRAAAVLSTAFRNRHVSREFMAFSEEKFLLSELILPGVMSVCSVNDLQQRQLLPRQLVAKCSANQPGKLSQQQELQQQPPPTHNFGSWVL